MRYISNSILAVSLLFALASCDILDNLAEFESRSFTFVPTVQGVHHTGDAHRTGACLDTILERRGTGSRVLADWQATAGSVDRLLLAGYSSYLSRGADPFPCNLWVHHQFQVKTLFDLSDLPDRAIVEDARLRLVRRSRVLSSAGPASTPCTYTIGTAIGVSNEYYEFSRGADQAIESRPARPGTTDSEGKIDVTRTVARWAREGTADNWFVVSIAEGRAFEEHGEEDGFAYCSAFISDLSLEITALVPPAP